MIRDDQYLDIHYASSLQTKTLDSMNISILSPIF